MPLAPLYTPENVKFAYQLNWSLTVFWNHPPPPDAWLRELSAATEADGVRILEHRFESNNCSLFLVSTLPEVRPSSIPWSIKGRLQHLLKRDRPQAFQRNYDLRSTGSTSRVKIEAYVASQISHHLLEDPRLVENFCDLQLVDPQVNLFLPRFSAHGRYWCNLQLVFVNEGRAAKADPEPWIKTREQIRRSSEKKKHLLSRIGILPDHLHLTTGTPLDKSPAEIALSYMNNIAYSQGMESILMQSCYLATFGEYDLGAIRKQDNSAQ